MRINLNWWSTFDIKEWEGFTSHAHESRQRGCYYNFMEFFMAVKCPKQIETTFMESCSWLAFNSSQYGSSKGPYTKLLSKLSTVAKTSFHPFGIVNLWTWFTVTILFWWTHGFTLAVFLVSPKITISSHNFELLPIILWRNWHLIGFTRYHPQVWLTLTFGLNIFLMVS